MRSFLAIPLLALLSGCGIPPSDIMLGGAAGYALFGDDIEKIEPESLEDPKTYTDAVPPQAKQGARRLADNVRDNVRHNSRKMKEWWFYDPNKKEQARAVPPSYCYTTLQDVVCYRQPMPGWEHRLVGYQGTNAQPPQFAMTEPLPTLVENQAAKPENRMVNAKPVFETIPEEVKQNKKEMDGALTGGLPVTDSAQEILPDPTLSPQL